MAAKRSGKLKVLIVEDHRGWRRRLADLLREEGHLVNTTGQDDRALRVMSRGSVDLLVLDVWLDGRPRGTKVCQEARSVDIPVILVSGLARESDVAVLRRDYGLAGYHEKRDFSPGAFLMDVYRVVQARQPKDASRVGPLLGDPDAFLASKDLQELLSDLSPKDQAKARHAMEEVLKSDDRNKITRSLAWLLAHSWELAIRVAPNVVDRIKMP